MNSLLKNKALEALQNCDDDRVLEDIAITLNINNSTLMLTAEQEAKIIKSKQAFDNGLFYNDADTRKILNEWSKK
jgi:hypothetical protein